ncbi:rCG52141 [Rattus norvegicus]|uniref:RCG52141 n=1 Tax=Rattus norvegicus TaxID=10116 RepID=A6K6E7_RAT|nr:rCG52141 [Rattus norvegicus]
MCTFYVVMVHASVACPKEHCLCYIKAGNGQGYKVDASKVTRCDVTCVLREPAHVLLSIQQTDLKMPGRQCKQGSWPLNTKFGKSGRESSTGSCGCRCSRE